MIAAGGRIPKLVQFAWHGAGSAHHQCLGSRCALHGPDDLHVGRQGIALGRRGLYRSRGREPIAAKVGIRRFELLRSKRLANGLQRDFCI